MKVSDLIKILECLKEEGKGDYTVIDEGYLNEINEDNIEVDDDRKEVIL